jgi:hypothetical protein
MLLRCMQSTRWFRAAQACRRALHTTRATRGFAMVARRCGKALAVLLVLGLVPAGAAAQQVIRGRVVEDVTRRPIQGATVELLGAGVRDHARATTDSAGDFRVAVPRAGGFGLRVSHTGFLTYEAHDIEVGTAEAVTVEVRLGRSAIPLEPLIVVGERGGPLQEFDLRRRAGLGRYMTREEIVRRGAATTPELLRGLPGISIRPVVRRGRTPAGALIEMRGGLGTCLPATWIDGLLVPQQAESTMEHVLAPGAIEAIEIYNSSAAAPAQYVTGSCGVILFWTRRGHQEDGAPWRWKRVLAGAGAAAIIFLLMR